ncbi:MAG: imelysin family protein [Saprospiraceae bacterium]|nr:imelysin family protein [Saprospiraceae bacterium]
MKYITIIIITVFFSNCTTPSTNNCATDFDQLSLLENIGNNIIIPTYQKLSTEASNLEQLATDFTNNPDQTNLINLRGQLQEIWLTWQTASIFEFGPAANEELRSHMNNFPVFTTRLESAIDSGSYDLTTEFYSYARGFPAIEYLIYGTDTTYSTVIQEFSTSTNSNNRKQMLKDLTALIQQKSNTVYDNWKATGANYLNTFTTTEGISNGKPMSDLVNQLNMNYELIKNYKLGIPISAKTNYNPLLPQNVEAYYSRKSLDLAIKGVEASKNVFIGYTNNNDNIGLDDYLQATNAKKGNEDLHTVIINQFDLALSTLNALSPSTLHDAINNNTEAVKSAYAAAQNQMVNTKTDMPSALCISITYVDIVNDGD